MSDDDIPTIASRPPEVVPEPGWTPIDPLRLEGGPRSFVSGEPDGGRLRVRYFRRQRDGRLVGLAWFGPGAQGPPGHAHGGSMAAVLDEAMGAAAWMEGHLVVAVRLSTSFQRMLPLGTDALMEAWVERVEGRKVWTLSRLLAADGEPFAEADALFLKLDPDRFMPLIEKAAKALGVPVEELLRTLPTVPPAPAGSDRTPAPAPRGPSDP